MDTFPHHYRVRGAGGVNGDVELSAERLMTLRSASPAQFGGPGDRWSPETLLVGAIADCFVLTFRAIARAARLSWIAVECEVTGTLDRVDRVTQFTRFDVTAHLTIAERQDPEAAHKALHRAEHACLVSNSLKGSISLDARVTTAQGAHADHYG